MSQSCLNIIYRHIKLTMNFFKKLTGTNFKVSGSVVESYEPVRSEFEQFFREGQESRAQLCVYVNEEKVIGDKILII